MFLLHYLRYLRIILRVYVTFIQLRFLLPHVYKQKFYHPIVISNVTEKLVPAAIKVFYFVNKII